MQTAQLNADAAEDSAIRRYQQLTRPAAVDRRIVDVSCGRCGAVHGVIVQPGTQVVTLRCQSCHRPTTVQV